MAEREGFEPSVECDPHTRLAGEHHQPARSSLRRMVTVLLAEEVGFEPTELSLNGFQDRRLRPLGHSSAVFRQILSSPHPLVNGGDIDCSQDFQNIGGLQSGQSLHGFMQFFDRDNRKARDMVFRHIGFRNQGLFKTMFRSLPQTFLTSRHRSDLS